MTQAVAQAVNAALARCQASDQDGYRRRLDAIRDVSRKFRALPVVGSRLTDDDLYDEEAEQPFEPGDVVLPYSFSTLL